jgi:hypothetical protein
MTNSKEEFVTAFQSKAIDHENYLQTWIRLGCKEKIPEGIPTEDQLQYQNEKGENAAVYSLKYDQLALFEKYYCQLISNDSSSKKYITIPTYVNPTNGMTILMYLIQSNTTVWRYGHSRTFFFHNFTEEYFFHRDSLGRTASDYEKLDYQKDKTVTKYLEELCMIRFNRPMKLIFIDPPPLVCNSNSEEEEKQKNSSVLDAITEGQEGEDEEDEEKGKKETNKTEQKAKIGQKTLFSFKSNKNKTKNKNPSPIFPNDNSDSTNLVRITPSPFYSTYFIERQQFFLYFESFQYEKAYQFLCSPSGNYFYEEGLIEFFENRILFLRTILEEALSYQQEKKIGDLSIEEREIFKKESFINKFFCYDRPELPEVEEEKEEEQEEEKTKTASDKEKKNNNNNNKKKKKKSKKSLFPKYKTFLSFLLKHHLFSLVVPLIDSNAIWISKNNLENYQTCVSYCSTLLRTAKNNQRNANLSRSNSKWSLFNYDIALPPSPCRVKDPTTPEEYQLQPEDVTEETVVTVKRIKEYLVNKINGYRMRKIMGTENKPMK